MPKNSTTHRPLPVKGGNPYDPNWEALERSFNQSLPICVTAIGTPTTFGGAPNTISAGSPGPPSYIVWQPVINPLYDTSKIVGPVATQNLRIPQDGFYDIWYQINITSSTSLPTLTGNYALHSSLEKATTSDTGYGAPVFTTLIDGPSKSFDGLTVVRFGDNSMQVIYRGIEMHANDLFRIGINMFVDISGPGVADITTASVVLSEFRFVYPIPNNQKRQP